MTPIERLDKAIDTLTTKALELKQERDDLLEACKAVVEEHRLSKVIGRNPREMIVFDAFLAKCQVAIARAEGREP